MTEKKEKILNKSTGQSTGQKKFASGKAEKSAKVSLSKTNYAEQFQPIKIGDYEIKNRKSFWLLV